MSSIAVFLTCLGLSACAGLMGGTDIAMNETHSTGMIDKGSISAIALAPVALANGEGNVGDVDGTTLAAYNKLTEDAGSRFKILTPTQFNAAIDPRMTDKEKIDALIAAGKKAGASHILVIASGKTELNVSLLGLSKNQAKAPVYIRVISVKTGTVIWEDDLDTTVSFGAATFSEADARKGIAQQSVEVFLAHGYPPPPEKIAVK